MEIPIGITLFILLVLGQPCWISAHQHGSVVKLIQHENGEVQFEGGAIIQGPGKPSAAEDVSIAFDEAGETAKVKFSVEQQPYSFEVSRFSVYADGGEALAHSNGHIEVLDTTSSMFKSRGDGKWATCILERGTVSGIFEDGEHLIELAHHDELSAKDRSLLQISQNATNKHFAWRHSLAQISLAGLQPKDRRRADPAFTELEHKESNIREPEIVIDAEHDGEHIFTPKEDPATNLGTAGITPQALTKWWPGCFPGDSEMHSFKVTVSSDPAAYDKYGAQLKGRLEGYVAKASLVYEKQLNIRLDVLKMEIWKTNSGAPPYAAGCPSLVTKLGRMTQKGAAAHSIFSGCQSSSILGVASLTTICRTRNYNANRITGDATGSSADWLTMAHELGHNFGGHHSFEDGIRSTGGIMDYGDGVYNGVFQFHTRYRKKEICGTVSRVVNKCDGNFAPDSDGGPRRRRSDPAPPPRRRRNSSPRRRRAGGGGVENPGVDCWPECDAKGGLCDWCGKGNACCREGWDEDPEVCKGLTGYVTEHHECVAPKCIEPKKGGKMPKGCCPDQPKGGIMPKGCGGAPSPPPTTRRRKSSRRRRRRKSSRRRRRRKSLPLSTMRRRRRTPA